MSDTLEIEREQEFRLKFGREFRASYFLLFGCLLFFLRGDVSTSPLFPPTHHHICKLWTLVEKTLFKAVIFE